MPFGIQHGVNACRPEFTVDIGDVIGWHRDDHRADFCRLLWRLWPPTWKFSDEEFDSTAASFDNPDFVATVVHSYRHRYGLADGDPRYASIEQVLAGQPSISVPAIAVVGDSDGVNPRARTLGKEKFSDLVRVERLSNCGHNVPQEKPLEFAAQVAEIAAVASRR